MGIKKYHKHKIPKREWGSMMKSQHLLAGASVTAMLGGLRDTEALPCLLHHETPARLPSTSRCHLPLPWGQSLATGAGRWVERCCCHQLEQR